MKSLATLMIGCHCLLAFAAGETLKVDPSKSRIHVDGKSTGHNFTGTLQNYEIRISGDPKSLAPQSFQLDWKFTDLKTADQKRDDNMIDWLGGGSPKGTFRFEKQWQKNGKTYAQGQLRIHGVTKTIAFPYTVKKQGDWVTIDGTAELDYRNFNLPIIRALAVLKVDPRLTVRFHVVGQL